MKRFLAIIITALLGGVGLAPAIAGPDVCMDEIDDGDSMIDCDIVGDPGTFTGPGSGHQPPPPPPPPPSQNPG